MRCCISIVLLSTYEKNYIGICLQKHYSTFFDILQAPCRPKASWLNGMKKLNNSFIKHKGDKFDPSALYLFVLQWSYDLNATGDMPRGKQFGYLFTKTALQLGDKAIYRTIAHEIAHVARSLPLQDASRSKGFS